ncbi:MAG: ROK family protein [Bacillota bacterium]|nr:ROK family protein [Bacillota bacterium]
MRGVGVGVPGVVKEGGLVEWAPALQWRNLPLLARLRETLHYPVYVENDVNLLALGEYWYGSGQGAEIRGLRLVIVLGGGVSRSADLFRDRLVELCAPVLQTMPRLEVSALGASGPGD